MSYLHLLLTASASCIGSNYCSKLVSNYTSQRRSRRTCRETVPYCYYLSHLLNRVVDSISFPEVNFRFVYSILGKSCAYYHLNGALTSIKAVWTCICLYWHIAIRNCLPWTMVDTKRCHGALRSCVLQRIYIFCAEFWR